MSANYFLGDSVTATANEALTAYTFADLAGTTAKEALKASTADSGDAPFGIVAETTASGGEAAIFYSGIGRLTVDGSSTAIAAGDKLKPGASNDGVGIKAASDTNAYGAIALDPSSASGDIIRVLIERGTISA